MQHQPMLVPPRTFRRGRNYRNLNVAVVLSLAINVNPLAAQEAPLPPLPPLPGDGKPVAPRAPTPEELEAQRKAQEAYWQRNLERFKPFAHAAEPLEPDAMSRQRLLSAEALVREARAQARREHVAAVRAHAETMRIKQTESRARAKLEARRLGIKLAEEEPGGALLDFHDGHLVALQPLNYNAARTIAVDKAWTNSPATGVSSGPLTGYGARVGLWDYGKPLTNHQEFLTYGPRLIYLDDGDTNYAADLDLENHATQMAGTIGASGVYGPAIGMAYEAAIFARNQRLDLTEMGPDSVDYDIRASDHSYGIKHGWQFEDGDWWWYGPPNFATQDFRFGYYGQRAEETDGTVFAAKYLLPVFAAGNDGEDSGAPAMGGAWEPHYHFHEPWKGGTNTDYHVPDNLYGYDMINTFAVAKNVLTIGAINDLTNGWTNAASVTRASVSSGGRTDDGRIKPDLVANGHQVTSPGKFSNNTNNVTDYSTGSGTSSAAASVAGGLAQLDQRVREFYGSEKRFLASTYKGILILNANEAGLYPGPDYIHGWGVPDFNRSASFLTRDFTNYHNAAYASAPRLHPHIIEGVLTNGTTNIVHVNYPATGPLRVVLAWTDRPYHRTNGIVLNDPTPTLVNDLDVRVYPGAASSPEYLPYVVDPTNFTAAATWGDNLRDNVEMIVTNLSPGPYRIEVRHKGTLRTSNYQPQTTNQAYSLLIDGHSTYPRPLLRDIARVGPTNLAVSWAAEVGKSYKLQYATNLPPSAWFDATSAVTATNAIMAVTNVTFSAADNRFYRVILN